MEFLFESRLLGEARFALIQADADLHHHVKSMVRAIRAGYEQRSRHALTFVDDGWNGIVHNQHVVALGKAGMRAERVIQALTTSFALVAQKILQCVQQMPTGKDLWQALAPLMHALLIGLIEALATELTIAASAAVAGAITFAWTGPGAVVGAAAGWTVGMAFASALLVAQGLEAAIEHVSHAYPAILVFYQQGALLAWGDAETVPMSDLAAASTTFANGHLLLCAELLNALPLLATRGKIGIKSGIQPASQSASWTATLNKIEQHPALTQEIRQVAASLHPLPKTGGGGKKNAASARHEASQPNRKLEVTDSPKAAADSAHKNQPCKNCPTAGKPVNPIFGCKLLNGHEDLDFTLPGPLSLSWQRSYSSDNPRTGMLGQGWSLPISLALELHAGEVVILDPQHRRITFAMPQVGEALYSRHEHVTLTRPDALTFELLDRDGGRTRFQIAHPAARIADLVSITDANGNSIRVQYNLQRQPTRIMDSAGRLLALTFSDQNRLLSVAELQGEPGVAEHYLPQQMAPLVRYDYSDTGDLIRVRNRADETTREFAYRHHMLIRHMVPGGLISQYDYSEYTPQGRVLRNWTNAGESWRFIYGKQQTIVTDQLGRSQRYHFDAQRHFTGHTDALGKFTQRQVDRLGNLDAVIDANGHVTRYHYDGRSRLTRIEAADGAVTSIRYDARFDKPVAITDALGATTTLRYDDHGNVTTVIDALGHATHTTYDERGLPVTITDAGGGIKTYTYNHAGQLATHTDCSHQTTYFTYQSDGNLTHVRDALGHHRRYQYDPAGRLCGVIDPDGSRQQIDYDIHGRVIAHTDASRQRTTYIFDTAGLMLSRTNALGDTLHYGYDEAQRLTQLVNENGAVFTFGYDALDRLVQETGFDARTTRYRYDALGHTMEKEECGIARDALPDAPIRTRYERDVAGRLIAQTLTRTGRPSDDDMPLQTRFAYDALGRLIIATNADATVEMAYDALGQLVGEKTVMHECVSELTHEYDALGNRIQTTLPDGRIIQQLFYGAGHVHQLRLDGEVISDVERDSLHREIRRTQGALTSQFQYDAIGRLTTQLVQHDPVQTDRNVIARRYGYDHAGNLMVTHDQRVGPTTYGYDAIGRLLSATQPNLAETFAFDPAHNLIDATAPASGRMVDNQLTVFEDQRYAYDTHGNLVDKKIGRHTRMTLTWNAAHQLIRANVTRHAQHETPTVQTTEYGYDPFGRRLFKRDAFGITRFAWDGNRLLSETRGSATRTYFYAGASFVPLAQVVSVRQEDNAPTTRAAIQYFHTDHLGTPRELTDQHGTLRWAATYKAWGNVLRVDVPEALASADVPAVSSIDKGFDQAQPLRFQGQYFDGETGLHYNRFRYYDPDCGRFVSQDPIGLAGGNNLYQYAPNPSGWIDPLGLKFTYDRTNKIWTSPNGVAYGQGSKQGNRVKHVLEHEKSDPKKFKHSIFCTCKPGDSLKIIDEAWEKRQGPGKPCNVYNCHEVDMERAIGTAGESKIMIVTKPGTNEMITAYPI